MKTLQKFASVHANIHNHFSLERDLVDRQTYKERRSAAWRSGRSWHANPLLSKIDVHRGESGSRWADSANYGKSMRSTSAFVSASISSLHSAVMAAPSPSRISVPLRPMMPAITCTQYPRAGDSSRSTLRPWSR